MCKARLMGERLQIQIANVLMRHPTIELTADWYTELGIEDLRAKVWTLSTILGDAEGRRNPDEGEAA